MQTYFEGDQVSLFDQDTSAGKTSWAYSAQARRTGRISGLSWSQLLDYIAPPYQFLDLTPGAGNLLGQFEWEMRSALHGGAFFAEYWTLAQRRHRILLVADLGGSSAEKILFDYCGLSGNLASGEGTWQAVAESVRHCFTDTSWLDWLAGRQRENGAV